MKRAALLAAACGSPAAPPHNAAPTHDVELAVASQREVRVYRVADRLELERTVALPSTAADVAWIGDRVVVQLGPFWSDRDQPTDPAHDGEIGWVTDRYEPLPVLPESTWATPPPPGPASYKVEPPRWYMIVTATGEVWQARADWTTPTEGPTDDQYVYARRVPEGKVTRTSPTSIHPPELAHVTPPATPNVALVPSDSPMHVMRCGGRTFPGPADNDGFHDISKLTWLASEPPIFELQLDYHETFDYQQDVIFEGCEKSGALKTSLAGPAGFAAVFGPSRLVLVHGGIALDTVPGGHTAVFRD